MNVLYFTADWCQPCRMFKPVLQSVTSNLGIQVQMINVDSSPELVQRYSVTSVPTLIIEQGGIITYRSTGAMSKTQLEKTFESIVGN